MATRRDLIAARSSMWFRGGTFRLRSGVVLALTVGVLLANGLFFYNSHVRLAAATRDVAESVDARQLLSELLTVLLGAESGHRGFILTDEASNLAPYNAALQQADELLGRIGPLLQADAPQMQRLAIVRALVAERFRELSRTLDARRQQGAEAARRLIRDNQQLGTLDELRRVVGEMQDVEAVTLDTRRADWEEARFHAFAAFVVFLTVSAALVAALFGFMRREVVDRIAYNTKLKAYADELGVRLAELRAERNEIAQLAVASTCLQSCESLGELPAVLGPLLERLFPAHGGAVFARAVAGEGLWRIAAWGGLDQPEALQTGDCRALGQGREHRHGRETVEPVCPHLRPALTRQDTSTLCIPLTAHGETLGLLSLAASPPADGAVAEETTASAERLATMLAQQLGLTLASLHIREVLKEQSIRDSLTGVFNRRYLDVVAPKEVAQALRAGRGIALAMVDIDHFKAFNDRHGHQGGDAALVAVAGFLQASIRLGDWLFRYGGEEFLLLLQAMDRAALAQQLERLRQGTAAVAARVDGRDLPPVTISIGAAICPDHGQSLEHLLASADRALYAAKQGGRNRVRLAEPPGPDG
ncbi:MAG: diguanylate cyclase [Geminicoccaceae bacterium]